MTTARYTISRDVIVMAPREAGIDLFLAGLEGALAERIRGEADRLLTLLSAETPGLDLALAGQGQFLCAPALDAAGAISFRLAIEDAPLAAFLLARPDWARPRSRHVDRLQACCLAAAVASCARAHAAPRRRGPTTDRDASVCVGLRAVRLICSTPRWAGLWPALPDIPAWSGVLEALDRIPCPQPDRGQDALADSHEPVARNLLDLKAFGERSVATDPDRQTAEIHIRVAVRNRFNALGTAEFVRVV